MNRLTAVVAALAFAPAALAQENPQGAAAPAEQQPAAPPQPAPSPAASDTADAAALQGKVEALDATLAEVKGVADKLNRLKISGYIQARWAYKEPALPDAAPPNAYNTSPAANVPQNGFFIRRGRFKTVYDGDRAQFVLQVDAIPAGVTIKEGYASVKLPKGWAIDAGLQLFPFGYEVHSRSSSDLDTLERAAVTRAFLAGEYDLGVALRGRAGPVNLKVGLFNGNGIDGPSSSDKGLDNDQLKDVVGRATVDLGMITAGLSGWYGKTIDWARADDRKFDRYRVGADVQVFFDLLPVGGTAVKGEWIWGRTTIGSSSGGTGNGGAGGNLPSSTSSAPVPTGSGWYVILTQNVGPWNQIAARYEQYTPNRTLAQQSATEDTKNVKTQEEVQVALHTFVGANLKVTAAWFHPMFGKTVGPAPGDPNADQFIAQVQAKF
ncbi:MAG TPA: porin [Anaeromyxobacter sp.]|nr:porin [Anaeromyxobacter sp.]